MAEGNEATTDATTAGQASAPAQAASGDQASGAGASAGQGANAPETVSVTKAELEAYKANAGRYQAHQQRGDLEFIQDLQRQGVSAKEVRETLSYLAQDLPEDVTLQQVLTAIRTPPQSTGNRAGQAQGGQQQTGDPDDQPLTMKQLKAMEAEKDRKSQEASDAQKVAAAEKEVKDYWAGLRKDLKIEGGAKAKSLRGIIADAERTVKTEALKALDPTLTDDQAEAMADEYVPTKEQLAKARKLVLVDWKDLYNETVSDAARGQDGLPAGMLGGGAGGAQTPPGKGGPISADQKTQAVRQAIDNVYANSGLPARR